MHKSAKLEMLFAHNSSTVSCGGKFLEFTVVKLLALSDNSFKLPKRRKRSSISTTCYDMEIFVVASETSLMSKQTIINEYSVLTPLSTILKVSK